MSTRNADGHFVDMMEYENTKYNIQKVLATQYAEQYIMISWLLGSCINCH
jgi:hypothetical protein